MSVITKIKKFQQLTHAEQKLLLQASFYLTICSLAVKLVPFRILSVWMGEHMVSPTDVLDKKQETLVKLISRSIRCASNHLPWDVVCLPQAFAAKMILSRSGIKSTLFLGVQKKGKEELSAHAWLRAGKLIVTGATHRQQFTVVSCFY